MPVKNFPPIETADSEGLLALGGDLSIETLLLAYKSGIFPWPISQDLPTTWFSPDPRGILEYENIHISKSLKKFMKNTPYDIKFNTCFETVISKCSRSLNRTDNAATWITPEIKQAYIDLHKNKNAYCIETYYNNKLAGGLYGICIGEIISGESMFYEKTNASKIALISLMEFLYQHNVNWIDTQMITPVVKQLGGTEITREKFKKKLDFLNSKQQTVIPF